MTSDGVSVELNAAAPDHEPDAESRRRAKIMAKAGRFGPRDEDFLARGIAVARSGGDVRAWLNEQARRS